MVRLGGLRAENCTSVGDFDMRKLDFFFPAVKPQKAVAAGAK